MNEHTTEFRPLNCNPHHELLLSLQAALAQCSTGDRDRLFETRERLGDLTRRIESGPWGILTSLTTSVQVMLGHILRRGNLAGPEAMQIATDMIAFVDAALTLPPPTGGHAVDSTPVDPIALDGAVVADGLKLQLSPTYRPSTATRNDNGNPLPWESTGVPAVLRLSEEDSSTTSIVKRETGDSSRTPLSKRRTTAPRGTSDLGSVAYQMVNESRLGELLIKMGRLDASQLDRALVLQKISRKRLGDVLMAMEAVDLKALDAALEVQRQETLRFMDSRGPQRPDSSALGEAS